MAQIHVKYTIAFGHSISIDIGGIPGVRALPTLSVFLTHNSKRIVIVKKCRSRCIYKI